MTAIFFIIVGLFLAISIRSVVLSNDKYYILRSSTDTDDQYIDAVQDARYEESKPKDYYLYQGSQLDLMHQEIEIILDKYFTYYRNLDKHLQFKFFDSIQCFTPSFITECTTIHGFNFRNIVYFNIR